MMRKLQVLGISGSPRKGNSEYLLKHALEAAREVQPEGVETIEYSFRGKKMGPCIACGYCDRHPGECSTKDDFAALRRLWMEADVIIYSVPVYHMSMPGQLKCFIDRLGNSLFGEFKHLFKPGEESLPKLLKVIGSIAQGCHIFSGQEHALTDLINHALLMQSVPVTGDMWQSYIGGGGWTSTEIDRKALQNQYEREQYDAVVAVKAARDVGKRAVEICLLLHAGILARQEELSRDPAYKPLLDRLV
ncbi:MAG TPA: flavodoxin family protein [Bacillota bacterium]|nr:flavodoxin family protein [Bacillota bacterium]